VPVGGVAVIRAKSSLIPGSFRVDASGTGLISSSVTVVTGAGQPVKLLSNANQSNIVANALSFSTITVSLVDGSNNTVVTATNTVTCTISGTGTWDDSSVGARFITPVGGIAVIAVKSTTQIGQIIVNFSAAGLTGAVTNINTTHGLAYKFNSDIE
jgi:hypothetical protein